MSLEEKIHPQSSEMFLGNSAVCFTELWDEGSDEWQYGETLIRDSYFKDYAMDFADQIGAVDWDAGWPANCIDWEQASSELQIDYWTVDFDGVDYWTR